MIDINTEIKTAMLAKDTLRLSVLRSVKTAFSVALSAKNRKSDEISQTEEWDIIRGLARQREDSIKAYTEVGATNNANQEASELEVLKSLLPPEIPVAELEKVVDAAITEVGATSKRDMKAVLTELMKYAPIAVGSVDIKTLSALAASKL